MRILKLTTHPATPPWPRHEGAHALRGVQGRDPPEAHPQTLSQEGGQERSVET